MLRKLQENLIDEACSALLLGGIFRYRDHPSIQLQASDLPREALSGCRDQFFELQTPQQDIDFSQPPVKLTPFLSRQDLTFPSDLITSFPESQRVISSRWFSPENENRRVIIGVDGIVQMRDTWFRTLAEQTIPAGWDVVMMDAPFNFRRTPRGFRPGQLILGGNFYHFLNVGRESIRDLMRVIRFFQNGGYEVGLVGVSLGAWMVTTAAQLLNSFRFLHAVTPPLEMSWMLREGGAIVRAAWRGLSQDDLAWDAIEELMRPLSAFHFPLKIDRQCVWFHAAEFDRFVSTDRIRQYAERYQTHLQTWPRGHINMTCKTDVAKILGRQIVERFGN